MNSQSVSPEQAVPVIFSCVFIFIGLALCILQVVVFCKIYARAGYSWAMGLLMLIPVVNFVMMLILAFSEWPIQKQVRQLQQQIATQATPRENFRSV